MSRETAPNLPHSELFDLVETYWQALRGARRLPLRTEIEPAAIDAALGHALIAERLAPGIARFRVAGGALRDGLGLDPHGLLMSSLFAAPSRAIFGGFVDFAMDGPAIVDLAVTSQTARGRLLMLPLAGGDGTVNRVLGVLSVAGLRGLGRLTLDPAPLRVLPLPQLPALGRPALQVIDGGRKGKGPDAARPALYLVG